MSKLLVRYHIIIDLIMWLILCQLSILNTSSIFGRTLPSILAPRVGVFNLLIFFTTGMGVIAVCMAAIRDIASAVLIAIFYGFFSGACELSNQLYILCFLTVMNAAISLTPPALSL